MILPSVFTSLVVIVVVPELRNEHDVQVEVTLSGEERAELVQISLLPPPLPLPSARRSTLTVKHTLGL